jgi:hypothetical protein
MQNDKIKDLRENQEALKQQLLDNPHWPEGKKRNQRRAIERAEKIIQDMQKEKECAKETEDFDILTTEEIHKGFKELEPKYGTLIANNWARTQWLKAFSKDLTKEGINGKLIDDLEEMWRPIYVRHFFQLRLFDITQISTFSNVPRLFHFYCLLWDLSLDENKEEKRKLQSVVDMIVFFRNFQSRDTIDEWKGIEKDLTTNYLRFCERMGYDSSIVLFDVFLNRDKYKKIWQFYERFPPDSGFLDKIILQTYPEFEGKLGPAHEKRVFGESIRKIADVLDSFKKNIKGGRYHAIINFLNLLALGLNIPQSLKPYPTTGKLAEKIRKRIS